MKIKKCMLTASIVLTTSLFAIPALANNNDLSISNHTVYNLSFTVNGRCSNDFGMVHTYSIKTIPKVLFRKACRNSPICEVIGYTAQKCSGKQIGGVKYDFNKKAIEVFGGNVERISVSGSEFNIFFTQDLSAK